MNLHWLDNLAAHLAANSLGTVGTTIFSLRIPPTVAASAVSVLLTPTQGLPSNYRFDAPRVQVLVRSSDDASAWARAWGIYALLNRPSKFVVGSTNKTAFIDSTPQQPPFFVGTDAAGASLIACNYQLTIQEL